MNKESINKELISQIKNATRVEPQLVEETKNMMKLQMKKEIPQRRTFMKKAGICIISAACVGILCIGVGKFFENGNGNNILSNKETGKMVDEIADVIDIDVVGKSGKDLLRMVQIENAKDIAKIVICQNELADISWIKPIKNIEITNEEDINYFYSRLSELKIVANPSDIVVLESDAPKEREILLYIEDGTYQEIHYSPLESQLMECFEMDGVPIERKCFEPISKEFNDWLIGLCDIDVIKDYTKEYEHSRKIQRYCAILQQFEEENWYGGYEEVFDNGVLRLKVLLCDNSKNNQNAILEVIDNPKSILFETSKANYKKIKDIKEKISASIKKNHKKYYYIVGCGLTSKDVSVDMFEDVTTEQLNEFWKEFSEYREFISVNSVPYDTLVDERLNSKN
ncbi:MAG: hypothetical protein K2N51_14270 [Lachnospiraceae bacterium]|nr:hypothetical protein [Lachnospiraceae bacterium]